MAEAKASEGPFKRAGRWVLNAEWQATWWGPLVMLAGTLAGLAVLSTAADFALPAWEKAKAGAWYVIATPFVLWELVSDWNWLGIGVLANVWLTWRLHKRLEAAARWFDAREAQRARTE